MYSGDHDMDMRIKSKELSAIMGTVAGLLAVFLILFPERVAAYSSNEIFLYAPTETKDISA